MHFSVLSDVLVSSASKYLIFLSKNTYGLSVADASRRQQGVALGISPRGTLAWLRASQAAAFLAGRMYVIPDDCLRVAVPVLTHRIHLGHEARAAGVTPYEMVESIITRFELPRQHSQVLAGLRYPGYTLSAYPNCRQLRQQPHRYVLPSAAS